jgi:perosamine synthetase|tara:strand:+ start:1422 stop:2528 length:1107 start_codon:yes stop_codon:yes gene_type:complete
MKHFIPLASPDIRNEDVESVSQVLHSGNLVQGKQIELLEKKLADYLGVPHCIMLSNGTSSLHLSLIALGIGKGDEVIVPAFSYIATANSVELTGANPVFVDIDIDTFNIKSGSVENAITKNTKAIMIVHEFGLTADIRKIKQICEKHKLPLIEDAACALGAKDEGVFAGTSGIAGSFSFHPRKAITSGEGGAVVTKDNNFASLIRTLRNHGLDSTQKDKMDFIEAGYNYRMTDFQGALLLSQFKRFPEILERKSKIANRYLNEIKNSDITLPKIPKYKTPSWQTFHILLPDRLDQKETILKLKSLGIGTNLGAQCMPEQIFFKSKYNYDSAKKFPNAHKAFHKGLAIPLYEKLTEEEVTFIIKTINEL